MIAGLLVQGLKQGSCNMLVFIAKLRLTFPVGDEGGTESTAVAAVHGLVETCHQGRESGNLSS